MCQNIFKYGQMFKKFHTKGTEQDDFTLNLKWTRISYLHKYKSLFK